MSSIQPYNSTTLQYILEASQEKINEINKMLSTGLKSASDDPAASYIAGSLNSQALDSASGANNAQNGLNFLYTAQKAYSDIVTELNNISNVVNDVLNNDYDSDILQEKQSLITQSINKIKDIEENTTYNGINVFDNSNSVGRINEHMFAITTKEITETVVTNPSSNRGKDYSSYLNASVDRYEQVNITQIQNSAGDTIDLDANNIIIRTADEFISALNSSDTAGKTYYLMENIDLSSLGTLSSSLITSEFKGTLDGNGYAISNLTISSNNNLMVGLFSSMGSGAQVKNIVLKDFDITSNYAASSEKRGVGTLVGYASGATFENISVTNTTVQGTYDNVGGLLGFAIFSTVNNVMVQGNVTGRAAGSNKVGGIIGEMQRSTVANSAFSGNVQAYINAGGIVGNVYNGGRISQTYSLGNVTGSDSGGIVGIVSGSETLTMTDTYTTAKVQGNDSGALVGYMVSGVISNSYALNADNIATTYEILTIGSSNVGNSPLDGWLIKTEDGIDYAFANNEDYTAFLNRDAVIDVFFKYEEDTNSWIEMSQQFTADSFVIANQGSEISDIPSSGYNYLSTDGTKAFASVEDLAKYDQDSGTFSGKVDLYYEKSGDVWLEKKVVVNNLLTVQTLGTITSSSTPTGYYSYTATRTESDGNTYLYAFSSQDLLNKFTNNITGSSYYGYRLNTNGDINTNWEYFMVATSGVMSQESANNDIYTKPNDASATVYYGNYYFSSEEDRQKFIDYQEGKGADIIAKFWLKTGANSWDEKSLQSGQASGNYSSVSTGNIISLKPDSSSYDIIYQKANSINPSVFAFASEEDKNAFINYQQGVFDSININFLEKTTTGWQKKTLSNVSAQVFTSGNTIENKPQNGYNFILGENISNFDFLGDTYTISGNYAFKSETDKENFNDGVNFLGRIDNYFEKQADGSWKSASIEVESGDIVYSANYITSTSMSISYNGETYSLYGNVKDKLFLSVNDAAKYNLSENSFSGTISSYLQQQSDGTWKEMSVNSRTNLVFQTTGVSVDNVLYDYLSNEDMNNDTNRRYYTTFAKYINNGNEAIITITDDSAGKYTIDEEGYVQINDGQTLNVRFWDESSRTWGVAGTIGAIYGTATGWGLTQDIANINGYDNTFSWNGFTVKAQDGVTFDSNGPTTVTDFYILSEHGEEKWEQYSSSYKISYYEEAVSNTPIAYSSPNSEYEIAQFDNNLYAFKIGKTPTSLDNLSGVDYFYKLNKSTNNWDLYSVTTTQEADEYKKVQGSNTVQASDVMSTNNTIYAFSSQEDLDKFNNGNPTGTIMSYYEYDGANNAWIEKGVSQAGYSSIDLLGSKSYESLDYSTTITGSYLGTGEDSRNQTINGVTYLGNKEIEDGLMNFSDSNIWENSPIGVPTLKNAPSSDKFELEESSLSDLASGTIITQAVSYSSENVRFNTALTHSSFDFVSGDKDSTNELSQLNNKYISSLKIVNTLGQSYTEGTDYILYAEENSRNISWKIDILSDDMANKNLIFDYEYTNKDATQPTNVGFDVYLGNGGSFNIKDMALDLAGRLNINVTTKTNAQSSLSVLENMANYMNIKNIRLDGNIDILTTALSNKKDQKQIFSDGYQAIMSVDEAELKAMLAAEELKRDKAQEYLNYLTNFNTSIVSNLLSTSNVSQGNAFTKSLAKTGNSKTVEYFYKNLYDQIQEKWGLSSGF